MKTWHIALIGCGMISKSYIPAITALPNAKFAAVCDKNPEKAAYAGESVHCPYFTDAKAMLEALPQIEVCLIATPTCTHVDLVDLCAGFGKAVLCEKPIAMTQADAHRVAQIVRRTGITYMTAHVVRFWTGYVKLLQMMEAGEFGEIRMSYFSRCSQSQRWGNEWLYDPVSGGGAMYDMLVHDVDFMNAMFGPARSVYSLASKDETACFQNVFASIEYLSGARGVAETSFTMKEGYPFTMYARVMGSKATAELTYKAGYSINDRDGAFCELNIWRDGHPPEKLNPEQYNAYGRETAYFLDCLEQGTKPRVVTIADNEEVMHVINAIEASAKLGKKIDLAEYSGRL